MREKVTIVDIAKMAGVSTATVSRVLNNSPKVDPATRKQILDIIEETNYKPNSIAKALQASKSSIVGFVVPHINSPYFAQIFYETEIIAQKMGYTLILCNSEADKSLESKILNEFILSNVRAIVFMGGRLDDVNCEKKYFDELIKINNDTPLISCVEVPNLDCIQVYEDFADSSARILEHLAASGRKDVALLGGTPKERTTVIKYDELKKIAKDYDITIRENTIESDYSVAGGNYVAQELMKWESLPEAIICANDQVAIGLMSELNRNNIKVPEQIAVVGYDNIDIAQYIYPGLTTIATDYSLYAKSIVDTIDKLDELDKNARIPVARNLITRGTTML